MKEAITIISIISALSINLFKTSIEQSPKMPFSPSEIVDSLVHNEEHQLDESFQFIDSTIIKEKTKQKVTTNSKNNSTLHTESTSEIKESTSSNNSDSKIPSPKNTNGFNYLGHHYDLGNFSGTGFVPTWTNTVFQWNDFPNHYLVELNSYPGQTIFDLQIGSEVTLNGQAYTVYNIVYSQANNQEGLDMVLNSGAAISIQVCVSSSENSALNLYFLR
ncbi:MAG: hypothetical protein ACRCVH_06130 [Vagococcus fluvialis]|uniref:hypothetical protein n=1 Tax=Vagococcus fluvialis TaxID=2738 RepID=UPI000A336437|nr:hypothetical protein [Vagococcus fluvialis]MBO0420458.1 hypothetical protein [Vagococcus fluvialis]OTP31677.1 hypothetical protein A5798_001700 [Enterococcus sp. 6C8_DIV0013]